MFLVYLILYLFTEVMISSEVATHIGGLWMFLEIVISAFIGITLLKSIPEVAISNITSVFSGEIGAKEYIKLNLVMAFGAVLIVIPGVFTDMVGILLQFESFGMLAVKKLNRPMNNPDFNNFTNNTNNKEKKDETIIDVEIIDDKHTLNK